MIGVFFVVVFSVITTLWIGQGVGTFLLLVVVVFGAMAKAGR